MEHRKVEAEDNTQPDGLRGEALLAHVAAAVRAGRKQLGISQLTLGREAMLSGRFIAQLESGRGNISLTNLAEVAHALGQPLAELVGGQAGQGLGAQALAARISTRLGGANEATLRQVLTMLDASESDGTIRRPGGWPLVALVGLRGGGKSTLGPLLAARLGRPFMELDDLVQRDTGLPVTDIFHLHGEEYYRAAERRAIGALVTSGTSAVVALSGGAPADGEILGLLKAHSCMVWVRASPEQHMRRVLEQGDHRPMANRPNAMDELRGLLEQRTPYYEQAHLVADTARGTPEATVQSLLHQ